MLDSNKFSIGAWYKKNREDKVEVVWKWGDSPHWAVCYREWYNSAGLYVMDGAVVSAVPHAELNVWNHTCVTFNVNTWKLYRNGILYNNSTKSYIGNIDLTLGIFYNPDNVGGLEVVQGGSMSNFFLIKNKVLSDSEILDIYNIGHRPYYIV
jgi:hypothetical protein